MTNTNKFDEKIKASNTWDLYQERAFKENLLCQRFHFFLIVYALIVAAIASFKGGIDAIFVLIVGIFVLLQLWYMIWVSYLKFKILLKDLKDTNIIPEEINVFTDNDKKVVAKVEEKKYLSWLYPLLAVRANESDIVLILCNKIEINSNRMMAYSIPLCCILSLFCLLLYYMTGALLPAHYISGGLEIPPF